MIFTSCIPALDMLIIPLDPLSKPVGPIVVNDRYLGVSLSRVGLSWLHGSLLYPSRGSVPVLLSSPDFKDRKAYWHKGSKDTPKTLSLPSLL